MTFHMVAPHDDPTIKNDDLLVRFVSNEQIVFDENHGCYRPSSGAFGMSSADGCMSIDLATLLTAAGLQMDYNLKSRPSGSGAVTLTAGVVRDLLLSVYKDPVPENIYHGQIANVVRPGKISGGTRKRLSLAAQWINNPQA